MYVLKIVFCTVQSVGFLH